MNLAIDVIDRHGPNNEMHHQLQPKKPKATTCIKAALVVFTATKDKYPPFITNKTEHISFKSGCVLQVAKHLKGGWFIVLC